MPMTLVSTALSQPASPLRASGLRTNVLHCAVLHCAPLGLGEEGVPACSSLALWYIIPHEPRSDPTHLPRRWGLGGDLKRNCLRHLQAPRPETGLKAELGKLLESLGGALLL